MTVAHRPRRIRKVMRPLLQWYYNLNLLRRRRRCRASLSLRPFSSRDAAPRRAAPRRRGTLPSVLLRRTLAFCCLRSFRMGVCERALTAPASPRSLSSSSFFFPSFCPDSFFLLTGRAFDKAGAPPVCYVALESDSYGNVEAQFRSFFAFSSVTRSDGTR